MRFSAAEAVTRPHGVRRTDRCVRVGCSGWVYRTWRGPFYAPTLPARAWLEYYASRFDTVEVNGTFYRLPDVTTFRAWRDATPPGFTMAIKASRFLTHMKRLQEPAEPIARLFDRVRVLGPRLGPVVYQLPPTMGIDLPRLETFLSFLPRRIARAGGRTALPLVHVMEFRHPSWYVSETFELLNRSGVTLCLHDRLGSAIDRPLVGPIVYVRFHGTSGRYHGSYGRERLARWADRLAEHWQDGRSVFAYFNNDPGAAATRDAIILRRLLEARLSRASAARARPSGPAGRSSRRRTRHRAATAARG